MTKKHQISLKLTATQYAHITDSAEAQTTTVTDVVRQLIDNDRRQNFGESKSLSEMKRLHARFETLIELLEEDDDAEVLS